MTPSMMEELLFDDILYGDRARDEHGRFRRVLQLLGVELFDTSDLLLQALTGADARRYLIERIEEDLVESLGERLQGLPAEQLATALVSGMRNENRRAGRDELFSVPPVPNWCFQRDPQIVTGHGVIFGSMAARARYREAILTRTVFRFHPMFSQTPVLLDPLEPGPEATRFVGPHHPHLEGGDVLLLSAELLLVGLSERTNRAGIRCLARALSRIEDGPRWLLVVELPRRRAYMHLDTIITPVDRDACLVYPPVIMDGGSEQAPVFEIDLRARQPEFVASDHLLAAIARRGIDLEPILCGGDDPLTQQREQWTDGANALAVAPGVITLFDRNLATAEQLAAHGFQIIDAEDLLLGREEASLSGGERICVLIRSHEISRARGGPHCLLHPLLRDAP